MRSVAGIAVIIALTLGACGHGSSGGSLTSGIEGVVQAGPTCPVEQMGSPCPDAPLPSTVRAAGTGGTIAQTKTDDRGRFRLPLEPGTYIVTATPTGGSAGRLTPVPVTVDVKVDAFAHVTLEADTGIR